jgi:two-component system, NarL family, invasion response regulator UvrY
MVTIASKEIPTRRDADSDTESSQQRMVDRGNVRNRLWCRGSSEKPTFHCSRNQTMIDRQIAMMAGSGLVSGRQSSSARCERVDASHRQKWRILLLADVEGDLASVAARALMARPLEYDVSKAQSLPHSLALLSDRPIDAVVVVLSGHVDSGIEVCRCLHQARPDVPIVALSDVNDELFAVAAVASGAQDCLCDKSSLALLLPRTIRLAIERIRRQGAGLRTQRGLSPDPRAAAQISALTARQCEVLDLLVQGKSLKQIAAHLAIGIQAATKHRARIFRKCGVNSVAQLVHLTFAAGLAID